MTSEQTTATTVRAGAAAAPATFRPVPLSALVAVGFVALAVSPIAFLAGPWWLFYLLPLALSWWVIRRRTVVDGAALRVLTAAGSRRIRWDEVTTLRVAERGWVRAVRPDGEEPALVGVRARDLGRLAQASDGRVTMPTPEEIAEAREHERELEATRARIARLREREAEREAEQAAESEAVPEAERETVGAGDPGDESGVTDTHRQRSPYRRAPLDADTPPGTGEERA